jgi:glycosyltransferase involved in cell wall biosynthesis
MESNLISICIPTYNQTYYLTKTLNSVISQKNVRIELIITDDSTSDEVEILVCQFIHDYPEVAILYVRNEISLGSPQNWNYAISLAQGEYIKILHHDEYFISHLSLKKLFDQAKLNIDNVVFSASKSINKGIERDFVSNPILIFKINNEAERLLLGNIIGAPSAILFHHSKKVLFDTNLVWLVDVDFYITLLKTNCKLIYIDEKLYTSVIDDHNLTNKCLADTELLIREYTYLLRKHVNKLAFYKQIFYFYHIYKYLKKSIKDSKFLLFRMIKKVYYV